MKFQKILGVLVFGIAMAGESSLFAARSRDLADVFFGGEKPSGVEEQVASILITIMGQGSFQGIIQDPFRYVEENTEIIENPMTSFPSGRIRLEGQQIPVNKDRLIQILREKVEEEVVSILIAMIGSGRIQDPFSYVEENTGIIENPMTSLPSGRIIIYGLQIPVDKDKLIRLLKSKAGTIKDLQELMRLPDGYAWANADDPPPPPMPRTEEQVCLWNAFSSLLMEMEE